MILGLIIIYGLAFSLLILLGVVAYVMWDKSFKNRVMIARQTGRDLSDVIWIPTRFKVVHANGLWRITFRHLPEKTSSIEGRFWTKFLRPSASKKVLSLTDDDWKAKDVSKLIQRGLYLYETSEGVFFPMTITKEGDAMSFKIIDQNNRLFLINEVANIEELTKDRKRELIALVIIAIGIVVLGAIGIAVIYYMHVQSQESIATTASVCAEYAKTIINVTTTQQPTFLNTIVPTPGG